MKYSEELLWILDEPGGLARTLEAQNRTFQIRKNFVHELNLKCDCVGWCKSKSETLLYTDYNVLIPYYRVADGCFLSDKYEFLSSMKAMKENEEFQESLSNEELLDTKPEGVVIGRCPDGDTIFLCNDGKVVRFSHEEPVAVEQWPTLAQFFVDSINE